MKNFPISSEFISGEAVTLSQNSHVIYALQQGGAVVLRLYLGVPHYVLLTGIEGDSLYLFDPYYEEEDDPELDEEYHEPGITFISDQPKRANRLISIDRLNRLTQNYYEMGPMAEREACIVYNTHTQRTPETTIDYFI